MFHMTLLYEMQLLDELPMVWGSSYMVYCLYKVQIEPHQKTPKMAFAMISYSMAVTIVYLIGMFICLLFINLKIFESFFRTLWRAYFNIHLCFSCTDICCQASLKFKKRDFRKIWPL